MDPTTYIDDDGSTLTFDPVSGFATATPSNDQGINASVAGFQPQLFNPAAQNFQDVLLNGISRSIDAVTRPLELQNAQPVLQRSAYVRYNTGAGPVTAVSQQGLFLFAAAAVAIYLLAR